MLLLFTVLSLLNFEGAAKLNACITCMSICQKGGWGLSPHATQLLV